MALGRALAPAPPPADADARRLTAPPEPWGDDRDAPTPVVTLAADLPVAAADDPDPASAALAEFGDALPSFHAPLVNAVGVKFQSAGKIYLYDAGDESYRVGEAVVVESERGGVRLGTVAVAPLRQPLSLAGLGRVLRRPGPRDDEQQARNQTRAAAVLQTARGLAREIGLPVKVFRVELGLTGNKATVYFSSEDKIDFRRLLRDLGAATHLRIELRQTGVRDEAKLVGGLGSCGLELCCTTWLPAFVPVSIKHAKDQGLAINPQKVAGQCGRLKCCLVYEQSTYAELRKGLPKTGKRVVTADGEGRVVEVDVLRQRVRVSLVHGEFKVYGAGEVQPMFPSQQPGQRGSRPGGAAEPDSESDQEPDPTTGGDLA